MVVGYGFKVGYGSGYNSGYDSGYNMIWYYDLPCTGRAHNLSEINESAGGKNPLPFVFITHGLNTWEQTKLSMT